MEDTTLEWSVSGDTRRLGLHDGKSVVDGRGELCCGGRPGTVKLKDCSRPRSQLSAASAAALLLQFQA